MLQNISPHCAKDYEIVPIHYFSFGVIKIKPHKHALIFDIIMYTINYHSHIYVRD